MRDGWTYTVPSIRHGRSLVNAQWTWSSPLTENCDEMGVWVGQNQSDSLFLLCLLPLCQCIEAGITMTRVQLTSCALLRQRLKIGLYLRVPCAGSNKDASWILGSRGGVHLTERLTAWEILGKILGSEACYLHPCFRCPCSTHLKGTEQQDTEKRGRKSMPRAEFKFAISVFQCSRLS
jgi:hypothetical protein